MNGYFYVLTTIDIFVLCFMCVLTDCTDFIIRSCYIKSGWFTKEIPLVKYSIELSRLWTHAIGLYMFGVCIG